VLGHDSDADLGYVSRHTDPVDVARESFEVQRRLAREGWRITRYSGASFKILVTEGDVTRGLDVFGGFLDNGRLYLMGEIGTPFRPEWIHPLGTATLEGRPMPVPAQPERLLEATYGPGWKVPDPAFQFETPARTIRALDDWFRGLQAGVRYWERRAVMMRGRRRRGPSPLARLARQQARSLGAEVLDVGAGRGADSLWLARQGVTVTAYDYVPRALEDVAEMAERQGLPLEVRYLNLVDRRSVYAEGARLAHTPRPRVVLARHVVDATSGVGRASLARLCSMALRDGGRLLAEFHVRDDGPADRDDEGDLEPDDRSDGQQDDQRDDQQDEDDEGGAELPAWVLGRPDVEALTTLLRQAGARAVRSTDLDGDGPRTVRVVGEW
jgi:SAM-dependent methyltransferase